MAIGDQFIVGEVWESPRGTLYRVVERNAFQAVLRLGVSGYGRKIRRGWSDVIGWVRVPEHNQQFEERGNES
jgi:hypothetical protein